MFCMLKTTITDYGNKSEFLVGPFTCREDVLRHINERFENKGPLSDYKHAKDLGWKFKYEIVEVSVLNREEVAELK